MKDFDAAERRTAFEDLTFATEPEALADCDVVLVCVKSAQTSEVAAALAVAGQQAAEALAQLSPGVFQALLQRIDFGLFGRAELHVLDGAGCFLVFSEYSEHSQQTLGRPVEF